MLGDRIEPRIQKELDDRKNALNRDYYGVVYEKQMVDMDNYRNLSCISNNNRVFIQLEQCLI